MPVYEYQGQFYELSETDPVAAKKKIVASVGGPAPERGFFPALRAGATELGGGISALMGRVGLKDTALAQKEYEAAKQKAAQIFQPTEEGWTEAPWTKLKETLGGSLPYMAAPLAAGAAATIGLPATAAAVPVLGGLTTLGTAATLGAAGLASAGQFTATNIARQLEEEKKRTGAYDLAGTDIQSAALAAIPQAALDTLALRFMPGVGKLLGDAGIQVTKESAKQVSEQILKKAVTDYALTTGKAVGREGLTESAQQVFERLQAGLSITDPDARREYVESFIGGAVLGGALAPAGRYVERGTAARQVAGIEQEEALQQRQAARAAEEERKKSPEYAQETQDKFAPLQQQAADLDALVKEAKAKVKASPKDKDAAVELANAQQQLKELKSSNEFRYLSNEFARVAPILQAEQARVQAEEEKAGQAMELAAAQEIPQETQALPYYQEPQAPLPGMESAAPAPAAVEPVDETTLLSDVQRVSRMVEDRQAAAAEAAAKGDTAGAQRAIAQLEQLKPQLADLQKEAAALPKAPPSLVALQTQLRKMGESPEAFDPDKAKKLIDRIIALEAAGERPVEQPELPGMTTDFFSAKALKERIERAATEKEQRQAVLDYQKRTEAAFKQSTQQQQQFSDMYAGMAATAQRRAADRARAEEEARAEEARTQKEEALVGQLVEATGAVKPEPVPQATLALPTAVSKTETYDQATELRARLSFAQQTRNRQLESNVRKQLEQVGAKPEEEVGSALEEGAITRAAGVEGELTPTAMAQNRLTRLAQRQMLSYEQLTDFIDKARGREQTKVDERTKAQYKYRAEQLKQATLGFALLEINGRRQQYGLPVLEHKEAMRALTGLARPLNELISRGAQMFEEPVVQRAKYRGTKIIEGAQEFERPPAGKRTFSQAGFPAAAETLREQFRQTVETISGKPQPIQKEEKAVDKTPRRVITEQRSLFLTPSPAEEPVSFTPDALIDKSIDKAVSADDARLLRQMQEVYTQLKPEQQSVVREQAQRAIDGKPLDAVYEMRGLYQLQQREAATAAGQMSFLKPITLVTARKKIERLAQKAAELKKQTEEAQAVVERINAGRKSELERAQAAFDRAREQGKDLIDTAQKIRSERAKEIATFSEFIYTPLLQKQAQLNKEWDAAVSEFVEVQNNYEYFRAEFAAGRAPKTNITQLGMLEKQLPGAADRLITVSKNLDSVERSLSLAQKAIAEARERQATDTVTNALLKEAAKAESKIEAAQNTLSAARNKAAAAERVHKQAVQETVKEPTLAERISQLPINEVTRVFRDTNDPAVQQEATKKRSTIARQEGVFSALEAKLKVAPEEQRAAIKKTMKEVESLIQTLHNELYDIYNNAPLKRVDAKTPEAARTAEQLERANHEVHSAEVAAFNAAHDTARLSLPQRKAGPVISDKGVVKQAGERKVRIEPATPIDEIGSVQARINEITQQYEYIQLNPAQSDEGRKKQVATEKKLVAEIKALDAKLRELRKEQRAVDKVETAAQKELDKARTVSRKAIRVLRFSATDTQLFEDLAKAPLTAEQRAMFERAKAVFDGMIAPHKATVREQANTLIKNPEDFRLSALEKVVEIAEEGDIELSRGTTENPSTIDSVRTELKKNFPDLGRVQIYDSVDALIKANPQYEGKIPSDARGFVDTAGNKAFLIAENIEQGQALSVLLHEVGTHIGMKNMLGDAQYNALVNAVKSWEKKTDGSIEARVAKAARSRVEAAETKPSQVNDELLAYAVEEAVNAGVKPAETKGVLGQWLSQIASLFRRALERFGLPPKAIDTQGLVDLAFGAAQMEMRGQVKAVEKERGELLFAKMAPVDAFLKDVKAVTTASLGEKGLRAFGDVEIDIKKDASSLNKNTAYLSLIRNLGVREKGAASAALKQILALADKHGITLTLSPEQVGNLGMSSRQLEDWYARNGFKSGDAGMYRRPKQQEILFSRNLPTAARVADQIIGKQPTVRDSVKKNMGLAFRTQVIDALAPLEKIANTAMDALKGTQMMYYLRMYGMRNNMVAEAISNGVVQLKQLDRVDGEKEWVIESEKGVNIKDMVKRLAQKDVAKAAGSPDAANRLFTLYMAALRGERVGYNKLSFGRAAAEAELREVERELAAPGLTPEDKPRLLQRKAYLEKNIDSLPTEADFKDAKAEIESNDTLKSAFEEVREMYNEYNSNLLKFLVDTGAMSKDVAERLLKDKDYIPYYRMRGGNAELVIGGETPIRVGNIKDSPHLQELVGGEEPIFNFLDSSVQNTSMLLDMALRNIAAKNVAYELADVGLASKPVKAAESGAPRGSLEFKKDGVDHYVVVNTDHVGVPSDLLVKGMAGIPTMLPVGIRLLGIPARVLRRAVTSTPIFAAKQLFRDSTAAFILSGTNSVPLLGALRKLGKTSPLEARGITGGQTFTGMPEDVSRLLREMQEGRPGWSKAFAKMEALSIEADAATRRAQYDSYRAQGLSEMEATLMALESMNFSKRGLSPTMHMASTIVPFLNSQIQGLDVMYKALTGKLPFNEKLDIQRKLFTRGAMMFMGTMAYAAAMQDDEEYKNAPPDVKYGNWFVRVPFLDQYAGEPVTVRVPIPFEVGYIFKALPEMLYNSMQSEAGAKDALKALNHILIQMVPGGSSMVPIQIGDVKVPAPVIIPAAMKPIIEVGLGKSFFTGRDIESAREQQEVPGMRYRPGTSEIAKYIGEATNFSPIKIETLVSGYTGGLGLALLQALSLPLPKAATEVPEKRWSELPLVGSIFQPSDAPGIVNDVYERLQKVTQASATYKGLMDRGEVGKAQEFLQKNLPLIALESLAGDYRKDMGELAKDEREIRGAPTLTKEEKTKLLAQIRQTKIQIATQVRTLLAKTTEASERKALQAAPA